MSGDEKDQQIGQIVTQYQKSKVELAHLEQKLKKIGATYSEIGNALSEKSSMNDYSIENGRFVMRYRSHLNINPSTELLNEEALMAVIRERDKLKKEVSELLSQLKSLGITNLE